MRKSMISEIKASTLGRLLIVFILTIGLTSCGGGGKKATNEIPTSFATCDELKAYTQYYHYSDLKAKWGEGKIDEPWDASGVGKFDMKVNVTWENIKCNNKPVTIMFTNSYYSTSGAFSKNPEAFDGIFCDNYK